jgi:hypothetical protein
MIPSKKIIAVSCLVSLATVAFAPSADAFRSSVGAVSGQKKLTEGMGSGESDLAFSPILLEMAKLIGRTGLPPGFFLQNDGPLNDEQGVDLRTLLLYQAGLIKMPIRLITGKKANPQQNESAPTLMLPTMPDLRLAGRHTAVGVQGPSNEGILQSKPLPRQPEAVKVISKKHPSVGDADKISIAAAEGTDAKPAPEPMISIDVSKLQADLKVYGEEEPTQVKAEMPQLAMAMPRTNVMPFITNNAFRLWTFRSDATPSSNQAAETATVEYNGTFVVATTGAIKSITGRHFELQPGKLLASNKGGQLLFKTPVAYVSVEPEATAVLEVIHQPNGNLVKIYSLETTQNGSVEIQLPGEKGDTVRLAAGEALLIADHPLAAADLQGNITAKKMNATTARGSFSLKEFVENDLIAAPQAKSTDAEQISAMSALKKRVSGESQR